jgi:DNA-binding FadR family transcriptional regulator
MKAATERDGKARLVAKADLQDVVPEVRRNLTHGMLDRLGREIVTGRYTRRPFPTEAELALQHGVSRSVTREAVKMLTAKGLVSARARKGTMVMPSASWNLFDTDVLRWLLEREFSVGLLREFNQLRIAIEPEAAALAARYGDEEQIAVIESGLQRLAAADGGGGDTLDADIAFHIAILLASGNPFYVQFCDLVATALRTSIQLTNRVKGRSASLADHAAVRDAIVARDPDGARAAMRHLISEVLVLIDRTDAAEVSPPPS